MYNFYSKPNPSFIIGSSYGCYFLTYVYEMLFHYHDNSASRPAYITTHFPHIKIKKSSKHPVARKIQHISTGKYNTYYVTFYPSNGHIVTSEDA